MVLVMYLCFKLLTYCKFQSYIYMFMLYVCCCCHHSLIVWCTIFALYVACFSAWNILLEHVYIFWKYSHYSSEWLGEWRRGTAPTQHWNFDKKKKKIFWFHNDQNELVICDIMKSLKCQRKRKIWSKKKKKRTTSFNGW